MQYCNTDITDVASALYGFNIYDERRLFSHAKHRN